MKRLILAAAASLLALASAAHADDMPANWTKPDSYTQVAS